MADKRNQSPHYIPELDPEHDQYDAAPDYPYGLMVTAGMLLIGAAMTYRGVSADSKFSLYIGLFVLAVTAFEVVIGLVLHRKRNSRES
ncbi:hypothetical protein [Hyphococcus sp.]|uniref:hypothetical protein n=1 Tax=Hyphococcus sp. TaxID=2038636 RepID=UPI0035C66B17